VGGILYYVAGARGKEGRAVAKEAGLEYAFDESVCQVDVMQGPDGGAGLLLGESRLYEIGREFAYRPGLQSWSEHGDSEGVWLGLIKSSPVEPKSLIRSQIIPGHEVRLADGNDWLIPVARGFSDDGKEIRPYCNLPCSRYREKGGGWRPGEVVPQYQTLWEVANNFWDVYSSAVNAASPDDKKIDVEFTYDDEADAACVAIAANYRVSATEVSLLGLLDDTTIIGILRAMADIPFCEEWLKKKAASIGDSTEGGQPAEPPGTTQQ